MDRQQIQKIITAKRQQRLPSEPAPRAELHSELQPRPLPKGKSVAAPDPKESEATTDLEKQLELNFKMPSHESGHLESLVEPDRGGSLFNSGWEYSQLLKELRF